MQLKKIRTRRRPREYFLFPDGSVGAKLLELRNEFSRFDPVLGSMNVVDVLDEAIMELFVADVMLEGTQIKID